MQQLPFSREEFGVAGLARALHSRRVVTRSLLVSLLFAAAPAFADADLVAQAESSWAERSTDFARLGTVSPVPVQRAIAAWEAALAHAGDDVELRFQLIEALYFWRHFAAPDAATGGSCGAASGQSRNLSSS